MRAFLAVLAPAVFILFTVPTSSPSTSAAGPTVNSTFKIAYYNIQSGMGTAALTGTCPFVRNSNCTDPSSPLNAWGVGAVQEELQRAVNDDPAIIALGLSEAWACASPAAVLSALGWRSHAGERNGVSLLARHGFAGAAEWIQLDTSLNTNPADTMWVVRAPACADAACSRSIEVFSAHWYGTGTSSVETYERQAHATADFMDRLPADQPRVLIGDLNVFEEGGLVCNQYPVPSAMQILRDAGNLDAWPSVHGLAEGYTGMWNRNGCGDPNGYLWKRIDQSWSKNLPSPVTMTRFGMVTPGTCAPSDHAGIVVEYPWSADVEPPPETLDFTLTVSPGSRRVRPGASTTFGVTTNVTSGSPTALAFSVSGLPPGATATFAPESVTGSGSATLAIATTTSTTAGDHALTVTAEGGGVTKTTAVSLKVSGRNR